MSLAPLEFRRDGDVVVASPRGDIDMSVTPELTARMMASVPNDAIGLVIDLSSVVYIDSAGIQMLFAVARDLAIARQTAALAVPAGSHLRKLLKIANLSAAMDIDETVARAVQRVVAAQAG